MLDAFIPIACVFGYIVLGGAMAIFGRRRGWYEAGRENRTFGVDEGWHIFAPLFVLVFWPLVVSYHVVVVPFRAALWLIDWDAARQKTAAAMAAAKAVETDETDTEPAGSEADTYRQRSCPHCNKAL